MRRVDVAEVAARVREAVQAINFHTPEPVLVQLQDVLAHEPSAAGRLAMHDIVENRAVASSRQVPMCQDTGMAVVFVELGQEVQLIGGDLRAAITEGVRQGCREGYLRHSVVAEPLFERTNTGDNTPPVIHFDLRPGDQLRLTVAAKGFGAENMSRVRVLTPARRLEALKEEVVNVVQEAGLTPARRW